MKPTNEKSLFHFILDVMDKVVNDQITTDQAQSVAKLSNEATKLLKNEQERVKLEMQMDEHARNFGRRPFMRELASKGFANTTGQFIEE